MDLKPLNLLSVGAGVQSSTACFKAADGEIQPMCDGGIFADTRAEPASVYEWLHFLCGAPVEYFTTKAGNRRARTKVGTYQSGKLPFPLHVVSYGDLIADTLEIHERLDGKGKWTFAGVPSYTHKLSDNSWGIAPRQCTHTYKVDILDKKQRQLAGRDRMLQWKRKHAGALYQLAQWKKEVKEVKRFNKGLDSNQRRILPARPIDAWNECQADPVVVCWLGISWDEIERMKSPRHPWQNFRYPLIETRTTRRDCVNWMKAHGYPEPPRSACNMCPYRRNVEWRRLRDEEPDEFKEAIWFEKEYQKAKAQTLGFDSIPYLHDSRIPLDEVDLSTEVEKGQMEFGEGFGAECEGMCGV